MFHQEEGGVGGGGTLNCEHLVPEQVSQEESSKESHEQYSSEVIPAFPPTCGFSPPGVYSIVGSAASPPCSRNILRAVLQLEPK